MVGENKNKNTENSPVVILKPSECDAVLRSEKSIIILKYPPEAQPPIKVILKCSDKHGIWFNAENKRADGCEFAEFLCPKIIKFPSANLTRQNDTGNEYITKAWIDGIQAKKYLDVEYVYIYPIEGLKAY